MLCYFAEVVETFEGLVLAGQAPRNSLAWSCIRNFAIPIIGNIPRQCGPLNR
jgi:hypothetical protein